MALSRIVLLNALLNNAKNKGGEHAKIVVNIEGVEQEMSECEILLIKMKACTSCATHATADDTSPGVLISLETLKLPDEVWQSLQRRAHAHA